MRLRSSLREGLKIAHEEFRDLKWRLNRATRQSFKVSSQQGDFEVLSADTVIGRQLYVYREFELEYTGQVLSFLREQGMIPRKGQGTVLDVGANIGVTSLGMLHNGEFARSISVEPAPPNFALLERNRHLNGLDERAILLQYAASDTDGSLEFELSSSNYGDHRVRMSAGGEAIPELNNESDRRVISVAARRIDDLLGEVPEAFARDVCLMWIDVQGHEGHAFRGAEKLIASGIPVVSEVCPYAIARSGMSEEEYCGIVSGMWTHFWVLRRDHFVRYPIDSMPLFLDELGRDGFFENVVFAR